ncbi:hypothetical protein [Paenibacillus nasutitermitis]|uniref:Uncharacterized protein n=1 Tax=Paenibacillus nasutitermitis TaxID=1652958 RepID=A0A917E4G0_9BACL|nr:hypothetical protein [Paenibacillus nasutitermitis]GGD99877.1 hypothetical protein GCM10010911_68530 [Paenibacillus nasutitermitis]
MTSFLMVIFTLLFFASIAGIINPKMFDKLFKRRVKRWMFAVGTVVLLLLIGVTAPSDPETEAASVASVTSSAERSQAKVDADAKAKEDADAQAKKESDSKTKEEAKQKEKEDKVKAEAAEKAAKEAEKAKKEEEEKAAALELAKNPDWDKSEMDALKNGNPQLAFQMLEAIGDTAVTPTTVKAGSVFKAPWNYYGKPIQFTVDVAIVQDYPPDGDNYIKSEVVGQTPDGTILDIFSMVGSGDIQVGDQITVVAYPVGIVSVDNKLGGQTDQLALVTNKL